MSALETSVLLANLAWAIFWVTVALFLAGTLIAAIIFAPWPLKAVFALLLLVGVLATASKAAYLWYLNH